MRRTQSITSCAVLAGLGILVSNALADYSTGFESPAYTAGPLDGQNGWTSTLQANEFGSGNVYSSAANVVVSNTNPSTGTQAVTASLYTYDNQGGGYQVAGTLTSHAVPTTSAPTLVSFDLRVNNDVSTDPDIVDKAFFLTNAAGYVMAGIDFQQDAQEDDNSVGFYSNYDNGGSAYPSPPVPAPHHLTYNTSPKALLTPNAYQTWGIEEDPTNNKIHYFLNNVDVFDCPSFQGTSISGITFIMANQDSLSYNETQLGETVNLDNIVVAPPPSVWNLAGSGSWTNASSWAIVVPNAAGATASFLGAITANATVTVTSSQTVGAIIFDNSHSYTIAGIGPLTFTANSGPAAINVSSGSHTIQTPVIYTGGLTVTTAADPAVGTPSLTLPLNTSAAGLFTKSGPGTIAFAASTNGITSLNLPSISVSAGALVLNNGAIHADRTLLTTSSLTIAGKVDLGSNDMDLQLGGTTALSAITSYLQSGFNSVGGGNWNGNIGIISSVAATNSTHLTTLGAILNSADGTTSGAPLYGSSSGSLGLFDGANPSNTDVLIKYTYYGDANLDGKVDGSDYSRIDSGYLSHATGWFNGDFNYDGVVNGSDYTLIDNAFNTQGARISSEAAESTALIASTAAVPESTTLTLVGTAVCGLLARRRRP